MATRVLFPGRMESRKKKKKSLFLLFHLPRFIFFERYELFFPCEGGPSQQRERKRLLRARTKRIVSAAPPRNAANNRQLPTAKHGEVIYRLAICRNGALFISTSPPEPIWVPRRPGGGGGCAHVRKALRRAASRLPRQEEAAGEGVRRRRLEGVWWQGGRTRRLWLWRYFIGGIEGGLSPMLWGRVFNCARKYAQKGPAHSREQLLSRTTGGAAVLGREGPPAPYQPCGAPTLITTLVNPARGRVITHETPSSGRSKFLLFPPAAFRCREGTP